MTKIKPIEERALHAHIRKRTVRLLDFTDKGQGGSGVAIQLKNRFFIATAAHVIPKNHDMRILDGTNQISRFENWQFDKDNDVGFLELAPDVARDIDREFTTRIIHQLEQADNWAATIIGYPGQSIETTETVRGETLIRTHNFHTLALVSELISASDWPTSGDFRRRPPQIGRDVFVRFDSQCQLFDQDLTDLDSSEFPQQSDDVELAGMSGCGIWVDQYKDDGIWAPKPSLLAIQTGTKANEQWARGTQLRCWLQLVVEHYPDLASIAEQL